MWQPNNIYWQQIPGIKHGLFLCWVRSTEPLKWMAGPSLAAFCCWRKHDSALLACEVMTMKSGNYVTYTLFWEKPSWSRLYISFSLCDLGGGSAPLASHFFDAANQKCRVEGPWAKYRFLLCVICHFHLPHTAAHTCMLQQWQYFHPYIIAPAVNASMDL